MRILVIEEEVRLASLIKDSLLQAKYFVDVVHDCETGLDYANSGIYDGIVADASLTNNSIPPTISALRQENIMIPVLFLTTRQMVSTAIVGLDPNTDGTLLKPFPKKQLLSSLRTLLRGTGDTLQETLSYGDLSLHLDDSTLTCTGHTVRLSTRELELARLFLLHQQEVVPKETIFLKIWGFDSEAESNVVEAYVSFLRRKIKQIGSQHQLVAVRKQGYRLQEKESV